MFLSLGSLFGGRLVVDVNQFGKSLGGWEGRKGKLVEYEMSDNRYRTFRPDITLTPDGGLFISLRIDHVRGFFASDDHASLELTIDREGKISTTRSSISIQGKRITSDVIAGGVRGAGQASLGLSPAETVVAVGTDLVANLTEKLSRESKVEPGRVIFPAVVRHNLNLLYQAIGVKEDEPEPEEPEEPEPEVSDQSDPTGPTDPTDPTGPTGPTGPTDPSDQPDPSI